jgi:hypothetical protein
MRHPIFALLLAAAAACLPFRSAAQEAGASPPPAEAHATPWALAPLMEMLYERTIFNIDVLTVCIGVDPGPEAELRALVDGADYGPAAADAVVARVMDSHSVLIRSRFHRDVGLDQFLGGVRDSLERARDGGYLAHDELEAVFEENVRQFQPFHDRGFRSEETITYRIRGDRLDLEVRDANGGMLFENRVEGDVRRGALLGGYFAPDSDFREGLLRSLFATGG